MRAVLAALVLLAGCSGPRVTSTDSSGDAAETSPAIDVVDAGTDVFDAAPDVPLDAVDTGPINVDAIEEPCGAHDMACCAGATCASSTDVCLGGLCRSCGAARQPCCATAPGCGAGNVCTPAGCVPCGAFDQPCCLGDTCTPHPISPFSACVGGTCVLCGMPGRPCCAGNTCDNSSNPPLSQTACSAGGTCALVCECSGYRDRDNDWYGTSEVVCFACADRDPHTGRPPVGITDMTGDCDDSNRYVNAGAAEVCDGIDNNCDGVADNDPPGGAVDTMCGSSAAWPTIGVLPLYMTPLGPRCISAGREFSGYPAATAYICATCWPPGTHSGSVQGCYCWENHSLNSLGVTVGSVMPCPAGITP